MARFRCPSASTISSTSSMGDVSVGQDHQNKSAVPSKRMPSIAELESNHRPSPPPQRAAPAARKLDKGKIRARGSFSLKLEANKKEEIRMAKKKAEVKNNQRQWSFVFVGNLSSHVVEAQLEDQFKQCGAIRRVQIRASRGVCVPTANLPRPYFGFGEPLESVHYATVEFMTPAAARKALELNGREFAGRKLVVSFNALDMPETIEILKSQILKKKEPYVDKRTLWKRKFGQLKRLTIEKTEYISVPGPSTSKPITDKAAGLAKRIGTAAARQGDHFPYPKTVM